MTDIAFVFLIMFCSSMGYLVRWATTSDNYKDTGYWSGVVDATDIMIDFGPAGYMAMYGVQIKTELSKKLKRIIK